MTSGVRQDIQENKGNIFLEGHEGRCDVPHQGMHNNYIGGYIMNDNNYMMLPGKEGAMIKVP
jgi:hypothetical protein